MPYASADASVSCVLGDDVVVDQDGADRPAGALGLLGRLVDGGRINALLFERIKQ